MDSRIRGNDKGLLMFLFQKCVTPDKSLPPVKRYESIYTCCVIFLRITHYALRNLIISEILQIIPIYVKLFRDGIRIYINKRKDE